MNSVKTVDNIFSNRKRLFWIGNSLYWGIEWVANCIVYPQNIESYISILILTLVTLEGSAITAILRLIYKKKILWLRYSLTRLLLLLLLYSFIASLVWDFAFIITSHTIRGNPISFNLLNLLQTIYISYFSIFLWSSLYLGYKIWEESNNQKFQLEHERVLLKTTQLEMLKYQVNPHFLFNTLSSLRGLITADPIKAKDMVTHISEFLRYSLLEGKNNEVQLSKEIEIIKQYLNIEQVRYNEDLVVEFDISPETNDFAVPIFLIHPLVENAVKHGMQTSQLPLNVSIHSEIKDHILLVEVKNSGKWIDNDKKVITNNTGIGLQNIRKRLEHSFPGRYNFEIIKDSKFVKAIISIYFKDQ